MGSHGGFPLYVDNLHVNVMSFFLYIYIYIYIYIYETLYYAYMEERIPSITWAIFTNR